MLQFTACFSSRSVVGSGLALRSLVHSEFILVCGVGKWSSFPFFACIRPVFCAPFIEGTVCPSPLCVRASSVTGLRGVWAQWLSRNRTQAQVQHVSVVASRGCGSVQHLERGQ